MHRCTTPARCTTPEKEPTQTHVLPCSTFYNELRVAPEEHPVLLTKACLEAPIDDVLDQVMVQMLSPTRSASVRAPARA